jgi:hypothetical protein
MADFSPNGRYIAYQSEESGRSEIYVRPFPRVNNGRWQVSTAGGTRPVWARSGRELFYLDLSNALTAVPVEISEPTIGIGSPAKLFDTGYAEPNPSRHYDVSADGQRFLMLKPTSDLNATPVSIVLVEAALGLADHALPERGANCDVSASTVRWHRSDLRRPGGVSPNVARNVRMKCAWDTSAIRARRGMQSGPANVRSIASLARSIRRLHSSTDRLIAVPYTASSIEGYGPPDKYAPDQSFAAEQALRPVAARNPCCARLFVYP